MAVSRAKAGNIGSSQWIQKEKEQAGEFVEQEVEEFGYSVRNEMEWLNEHMAEIFSAGAVNYADVFKTPGKLRGKTPRTARKRDALEQRPPLTDIFAPNAQAGPTPAKSTAFYEKVTQFQIAEDGQTTTSQQRPLSRSKSPQRVGLPGNTDSGYHGMTEDEMEVETQTDGDTVPSQSLESQNAPLSDRQHSPPARNGADESEPVSDESFLSAREGDSQDPSKAQLYPDLEDDNATVPDDEMNVDAPEVVDDVAAEEEPVDAPADALEEKAEAEPTEQDLVAEMSHEPSETSSPGRPLERKSSFTFSSLPAREPLTAKYSIGGRKSNMEAVNRNSVFAKSVGKSFGVTHDDGEHSQDKTEDAPLRGKTSAQLLHERISMLGKAKDSRSSKSIPQALYPQLPQLDAEEQDASTDAPEPPPKDTPINATVDDEDDDWIAPSKPAPPKQAQPPQIAALKANSSRPNMHKKAISTTVLPSPSALQSPNRPHRAQSFDRPSPVPETESTTPVGSPVSKKQGEPVSASKKLWTAFKSARSLFASSAGSSAAAKLESHDSPAGKKSKNAEDPKKNLVKMPGALWSETTFSQSSSRPVSVVSGSPSRKTRSSTESDKRKDKDLKAQQKAEDDLEKAREKERQKAIKAQDDRFKAERAEAEKQEKEQEQEEAAAAAAAAAMAAERPRTAESDREDMPPPPPPKNSAPAGKLRAPGRPVRPTREATAAKAKPAPVNVRVASQLSQRLGQPTSQESVSSVKSDSSAPPPPPKTGLRTNSAQGNARSSTMPQNNSRVRALEAAARKKEQEEKEKQRKADQKRELERKRAAKAEEDRRIEQEKKAEEQRKLQESKLAAQRQAERQAAEAKRREQQRFEQQQQRLEQQRQEQQRNEQTAAAKAKAAHELAEAIQRERAEKQALPRGDVPGTLRQLGQRTAPEPIVRHVAPNPAKPPKRNLQQEDEEGGSQQQRPGVQRNPASYQQNDAKRRRTEDEQEAEQRHSVMAPPKRPSTMRKETLPKFSHGYAHAPPPAAHHSSSMFKSTVTSQHQLQHGQRPAHPSQTVQLSNARIPFAENANPPAAQYYNQQSQAHQGNENGASSKFRTPARAPTGKPPKSAKSSPMYPNGDNIALPEIMTDSEDEDDDDDEATGGFRAPSWVASPALRDLLTQQQLVDPETVFGAIPDLKMEEVFKGAKNQERLKRFRDRGSSAMWVETGDAVTTAEKQRDMEARERVYKEGGWTYQNRV